ncbi:MAG: hypothetical protein ACE5RP_00305 [Nitrosopumilus sp.]
MDEFLQLQAFKLKVCELHLRTDQGEDVKKEWLRVWDLHPENIKKGRKYDNWKNRFKSL